MNHSTPANWGAALGAHLARDHGHRPVTWLTRDNVGALLAGMTVNQGKANERPADDRTRGNLRTAMSTLGSRIARVLTCAGLKAPRQATHIFRDTMITWLSAEGLDDRTHRVLVGHEGLPGITAKYMNAELFVRHLLQVAPNIRGHLSRFPTREAVAARASELKAAEAYERWQHGLTP